MVLFLMAAFRPGLADEELHSAETEAVRLIREARKLRREGKFPEALQKLQTAQKACLKVSEKTRRNEGLAACQDELGRIYFLDGDSLQAMKKYEEGLDLVRADQEPAYRGWAAARLLSGRGDIYAGWGRLDKAKKDYNDALAALGREGNPQDIAALHVNLGSVAYAQGDYSRALTHLKEADEIAPPTGMTQATRLNFRGAIYLAQKNYEEARKQFQQALDRAMKLHPQESQTGHERRIALYLRNLALTDQALGRLDQARKGVGASLEVLQAFPNSPEYAVGLADLGTLSVQSGEVVFGLACLERALGLLRERREQLLAADVLKQIALAYRKQETPGDLVRAAVALMQAAEIVENVREKVAGAEREKVLFLESQRDVFGLLVQVLLLLKERQVPFHGPLFALQGDSWDAVILHWMERHRAKNLVDMLEGQRLGAAKPGHELYKRFEAKRQAGQQAHRAARQHRDDPTAREAEQQAWIAYDRAVAALRAAQEEEYLSLRQVQPVSLAHLKNELEADEALLEYYLTESVCLAVVLTRKGTSVTRLPTTREQIFRGVNDFREMLHPDCLFDPRWQEQSHRLYLALFQPVEPHLHGYRRLTLVPHGVLHYLPFSALVVRPDGAAAAEGRMPSPKYLVDRDWVIRYSPSATVLRYARRKWTGRLEKALLLANPDCGTWKLAPLRCAEDEAREVQRRYPQTTWVSRREATERRACKESEQHEMLHFATHAKLDPRNPLQSCLFFTPEEPSGSPDRDGRLTVAEVFNQDLNASLVCLSACETGLARGGTVEWPTGDDLVGLSRSYLYAGTPALVCSLWQVDDLATAQLMAAFHTHLTAGPAPRNKATALHQAAREVRGSRENYAHPFYWAAFVFIGDWR